MSPPVARPDMIVVEVTAPSSQDAARQAAADRLEGRLVKDMRKLGLPATRDPGAGAHTAHLDLRIVDYRRGSEAARMLVGFGAGKSALTVTAKLSTPDGTRGFALDAHTDSGIRPGLILPGGIAAATGDLAHLAVGGAVKAVTSVNDGSSGDIRRISRKVSRQVADYYRVAAPAP